MADIYLKQVSSIEKIFLDEDIDLKADFQSFSALCGERFAYQVVYYNNKVEKVWAAVDCKSPLKDYISIRRVDNVPVEYPCYPDRVDEDYLRTAPGLYPDILSPIENNMVEVSPVKRSLWVEVDIPQNLNGGEYPITIGLEVDGDRKEITFELKVIPAAMPPQKLIYTQWFHSDCIADYHNVEVFSKEYWIIVENYMKSAAALGINMILTPVFTPPLDTYPGGERTTVQLVDVRLCSDGYKFNFDKFEKWVRLAEKCGIPNIEISHLFTQWGAGHSPKIIASKGNKKTKLFGWETDSTSDEYVSFLDSFLPELVKVIDKLGIRDRTYFHVSDEPKTEHLETYSAAKSVIYKHVGDFKIMDALSDYDFYEKGVVEHPVVISSKIQTFIDNKVQDLWTYTCCTPATVYSNRFTAMPSGRNRIIGVQLYKYNIKGFLHWGFNFYNSQLSYSRINPYMVTDAGCGFPSGDAFSVYPYKDGAIDSVRARVFYDALQDIRALELLETLTDRQTVETIINAEGEITFADYPRDYDYLLRMRSKVNEAIASHLHR